MKIYFNGKFLIEKELSKVKGHPILLEETIPFVDYVQFRSILENYFRPEASRVS